MALVVGALAGAALGATACSEGDARSGPDHPVTEAVHALQDAVAAGDTARICERMTRYAQQQAAAIAEVTPTSCEPDVGRALKIAAEGRWGDGEQPAVTRVQIRGSRATAIVEDERGWKAAVALAREAGTWKLAGFFGLPPRELDELEDDLRTPRFPERRSPPTHVREGSGRLCPSLGVREETHVTGGCTFRVSATEVPVRVLTPFGSFKISNCSIRYRVAIGPAGRTWTSDVRFANDFEHGCTEIQPCLTDEVLFRPWAGRVEPHRLANYTHRTLICLRSHIGQFGGELVTRLVRRGADWQVEPSDEGTTGFKIDGRLLMVDEDFYLESP